MTSAIQQKGDPMSHDHSHAHAPTNFGTAFAIAIALNFAIVVAQVIYGLEVASRTMMKSRFSRSGCSWQALPVRKVA